LSVIRGVFVIPGWSAVEIKALALRHAAPRVSSGADLARRRGVRNLVRLGYNLWEDAVVGGNGRAREQHVDPALWLRSDMRTALAARDIAAVFRLLQRVGVSQRRIAALTGQSQSEISEILGGRHVVSYDVLVRIADGLGVPRGHLGLAYDDTTEQLVSGTPTAEDEQDARRLVARLAELTVGTAPADPRIWSQPWSPSWATPLGHVGRADVTRLEGVTAHLRGIDHARCWRLARRTRRPASWPSASRPWPARRARTLD
jgi:transcriptional regulator with XRE-family HTH domain